MCFIVFFRRWTQCKLQIHWRMKYDSGLLNDIGGAGVCEDCGYKSESIVPPPMPRIQHTSTN